MADLRDRPRRPLTPQPLPLWPKIFSISCISVENLAKSYVGAPSIGGLAFPPTGKLTIEWISCLNRTGPEVILEWSYAQRINEHGCYTDLPVIVSFVISTHSCLNKRIIYIYIKIKFVGTFVHPVDLWVLTDERVSCFRIY